jgi:hypothetical protein
MSLSIGTSYNLYAISEDGSGNTQTSSTVLNVTTSSVKHCTFYKQQYQI